MLAENLSVLIKGGGEMTIGVDIDAETPEEIAVSIMAEIIKVRREKGRTDKALGV